MDWFIPPKVPTDEVVALLRRQDEMIDKQQAMIADYERLLTESLEMTRKLLRQDG
jgi:hypothetical protein